MTDLDFNLCVDKYLKMVYRIAFHYFGRQEDAEDVSQNVFTKLYSSNLLCDSDDELKAWLIRVTVNNCHSIFRNSFNKKRIDLDEYEWEQLNGNSLDEQKYIDQKIVMDAVMSLQEKYRILVYLYYYEGYTCGQISKMLDIKETTVQTRLQRARITLKGMLSDSFYEKGVCNGI